MLVVRQGLWGERQPADPPTRTTQPRDRGNDKRTHWRPEKGGGLGFRIALTRHSSIVASLRSPRRAHHHSVVYRSAGHIHGWTVSALYLDRWYPTRSRNNIGSHPTLIGAAYTRGGCVGLREVNLGKRCFFEFLETDAGRHWNRKRKQSSGAESIPRLHRLSTRRTPEQLTRDFGIAVRHLLGGELQADLAEEFGVDAATISRACRDIPNLLPRLEAADGRMARYLAAFGWLPVLSSWTSSTGRCCDDIDLDRAQVHVRHALQRVKGVLRHVALKTDATRRCWRCRPRWLRRCCDIERVNSLSERPLPPRGARPASCSQP